MIGRSRPPVDPFIVVLDALLRPDRLATCIAGRRGNIRWTAGATVLWIGVTGAFVGLILPRRLPLSDSELLQALVLPQAFALALASVGIMTSGARPVVENTSFWLVRCEIAVVPVLSVALAYSVSLPLVDRDWLPGLALLLALVAALAGGAAAVLLQRRPPRSAARAWRLLLAGAALLLCAGIWWWPPFRDRPERLWSPGLLGLAAGLLRPASWLWEAPLAAGVAFAARRYSDPSLLRPLHPASFDELCLLPMPGLAAMLARACAANPEAGGAWLIAVADHAGQRRAATTALRMIVTQGTQAHACLFWLSCLPEGQALLQALSDAEPRRDPLIAAYAALGSQRDTAAWASTVARHRPAFEQDRDLPCQHEMLALLRMADGVLGADSWPTARGALPARSPLPDGKHVFWIAVEGLCRWAWDEQPMKYADRAAGCEALLHAVAELAGWPAALLGAMIEHLLFLLRVEELNAP